jgi:transposase-like protein
LQQLHKAIGEPPLLAICSDAYKGLTESVRDVFPHTEQRGCFRHLMQNYIKHFSRREHMYPATRAYRKEVHDHHKANVASIEGVLPWLNKWHSLLWHRSCFNPAIKCDYITNNIVEVFNN